jgi:hypothetical protein
MMGWLVCNACVHSCACVFAGLLYRILRSILWEFVGAVMQVLTMSAKIETLSEGKIVIQPEDLYRVRMRCMLHASCRVLTLCTLSVVSEGERVMQP